MVSVLGPGRDPLRILLVGNGGREHALAWKLSQSPLVEKILVVPGNGGTAAGLVKVSNVTGIPADDYPGLVALARGLGINLVVPGPEVPLVDGIEGYFREGMSDNPSLSVSHDDLRQQILLVLGLPKRPRDSRDPRHSPRISCASTISPRRNIATLEITIQHSNM